MRLNQYFQCGLNLNPKCIWIMKANCQSVCWNCHSPQTANDSAIYLVLVGLFFTSNREGSFAFPVIRMWGLDQELINSWENLIFQLSTFTQCLTVDLCCFTLSIPPLFLFIYLLRNRATIRFWKCIFFLSKKTPKQVSKIKYCSG